MRRLSSLICLLALAGCGGAAVGGSVPPSGISPNGASESRAALTNGVALQSHALWVAGSRTINVFTNATTPSKTLVSSTGIDGITVAPDGTLYVAGLGVAAFAPGATDLSQPENTYPGSGPLLLLDGGIDVFSGQMFTGPQSTPSYGISTYRYAAGDHPTPKRVLTEPGRFSDFAADGSNQIYVAVDRRVDIFAASPNGSPAPIASIPTGLANQGAMAVDGAGTVYVAAYTLGTGANFPMRYTVYEWARGNLSATPTRTLGPLVLPPVNEGGVTAMTVDGKGRLYLGITEEASPRLQTLNSYVEVFAPGASGQNGPLATIQNAVPYGEGIASLAMGP